MINTLLLAIIFLAEIVFVWSSIYLLFVNEDNQKYITLYEDSAIFIMAILCIILIIVIC